MIIRSGLIEIDEAIRVYQLLSASLHAGSLHPLYVKADAARDNNLRPVFWKYTNGINTFIYGFHLSVIPNTGWQDIQSPYGYGGPLSSTEDIRFLKEADEAFQIWARENRVVAEFVRFHPLLENWKYYGGQHEFDRQTTWIDCAEQKVLMSYEVRQRTAVRKAIKLGVKVQWISNTELIKVFPDFYHKAMRSINASEFYFFPSSYFEAIMGLPFISGAAAYLDNETIAMSLFLEESIGEYHLSGKTIKGAEVSASNLLVHEAALKMQSKGLHKFYLGGGNTIASDDSLLFFKKGFSKNKSSFRVGKRVFIPTAYEELKLSYPEKYAQNPQRILFYRS